jgi:preprotein translocase subunit Sec63
MAEYKYDESGAIFNFFLLAILSVLLLPWTYAVLTQRPADGKKKPSVATEKQPSFNK